MRICDAHVHVGAFRDLRWEERYYSPEEIAGVLKAAGVEEFIFSSISAQRGVGVGQLIEEAERTKAAFGEGAHAFLWTTKRNWDADRDFKILDSGLWSGVKLHELETPWVKEFPNELERALSVLEERGVPVQFHTGEDRGCYPREVLQYVKRHPGLRVDFAHCRPCEETIECMKECGNLWTDTAFMPSGRMAALEAAGVADRVMFGTDLPIQGAYAEGGVAELYAKELDAAKAAGYSAEVMGGNFRRFLGGGE